MRGVWKGPETSPGRLESVGVGRVGHFLPVVIGEGVGRTGVTQGATVTTSSGHRVEGLDGATACALAVVLEIVSTVLSRRSS